MWPQSLDNCIQKLPDGNDRIIAIKIELRNQNICLINTYMPTTSANSEIKYKEFLDIITHISEKYTNLTTILCGDLNGTLKTSRSNQHDKILQRYTSTQNWMNKCHSQDDTFFHHNGRSTSQIDYILTKNEDIIDKITIMDMTGINLSTHVPVICALAARTKTENSKIKKQSTVKYKIEWDRGNTNLYKTKLKELLAQQISIHNNQTTTDIVAIIIDCLKKAEKQSIPSRIIKLNGPKIKVSPEAKRLLNLSKQKHRIWVVKGRPTGTDKSYIERKEAKYNARKILRKERAIEKENFLSSTRTTTFK
ncbi:unnamed protein product [Mytilus edulis]|uniref:Endonuclease/exonuclease/phosphatase domain-containing protein n=1 Tax=Mytilus edulis TaxID=6550 RepID=A0A8S3Q439_MYTED|nr:unnamed protein product [Mytilus edulis]